MCHHTWLFRISFIILIANSNVMIPIRKVFLIFLFVSLVLLQSCQTLDEPQVSTLSPSDIGVTYGVSGGQIITQGYDIVSAQGICWSTNAFPTISDNHTNDVSQNGSFTSYIMGLTANTTYFIRAYATNTIGTGYGVQISFTTAFSEGTPPTGTVTDPRDGFVYNYILIGRHAWFAQNLAYIPHVSPSAQNGGIYVYDYQGSDVTEAKGTWNYKKYGCLYRWSVAMTDFGNGQDICPVGWHVSSDEDWKDLEAFLGMDSPELVLTGYRNTGNVGDAIKSTTGWLSGGNGDNTAGLNAVPAGQNHYNGTFGHLHEYGLFWTSTSYSSTQAYERWVYQANSGVNRYMTTKTTAKSIRCVKD
jgi:uncharacterized protein (TIGR02145 family)